MTISINDAIHNSKLASMPQNQPKINHASQLAEQNLTDAVISLASQTNEYDAAGLTYISALLKSALHEDART